MPPPSSGGVALALLANILRQDELSAQPYHGAEHLHLLAEAMRRAFADRNALLGDPDFVAIPLERLLSPAYGAERRASITEVATPSRDVSPGSAKREGNHTTHVAVVDARGAAVSLTTTINDFYGSGVTVTGAGFLLNDEMDDFTSDPGVPNLFGLVQGEANAIAPGKRMLSSMAPALVLDANGAVKAVAGARGPRIITATFQVILQRAGKDFAAVVPSVSILAENPVARVDKVAAKEGTSDLAQAYLQFLFSDAAQEIAVRHHFRPTSEVVASKFRGRFAQLDLVSVAQLGGWAALQQKHFADGGSFDQLIQ